MKRIILILIIAVACFGQNIFDSGGFLPPADLLLHMDGSDDGTTFTDASANNYTVTRTNVVTKTATKKFGTASMFNNNNGFLTVPSSTDWDITSKDKSIDFWVYMVDTTNTHIIWSIGTVGNFYDFSYGPVSNKFVFRLRSASLAAIDLLSTILPDDSLWYHVTITKDDSIYCMYVNDIFQDCDTSAATLITSTTFHIGSYWDESNFSRVYIDEFRITPACIRNRSGTPPNRAYGG